MPKRKTPAPSPPPPALNPQINPYFMMSGHNVPLPNPVRPSNTVSPPDPLPASTIQGGGFGTLANYMSGTPNTIMGMAGSVLRPAMNAAIGPNYISGNVPNFYSKDPAERQAAYEALAGSAMNAPGMIVSHGTPAFPESFANGLDLSHVREGTGGLAQGHGMYFGENPAVPFDYAKNFANDNATWRLYHAETGETIPHPEGVISHSLADYANLANGDKSAMHNLTLSDMTGVSDDLNSYRKLQENNPTASGQSVIRDHIVRTEQKLQEITKLQQLLAKPEVQVGMEPGKAHILTADIPDEHIAKMLDWDKPIKDQPDILAKIQGKLPPRTQAWLDRAIAGEKHYISPDWRMGKPVVMQAIDPSEITGKKFYEQLYQEMMPMGTSITGRTDAADGKKAASELLNSLDIPGNKYLDMKSRDVPGSPNATRNFVVVNPDIVHEIQHNGVTIYRKAGLPESTPHAPYHWADPGGARIIRYDPATTSAKLKSTPFMIYDDANMLVSAHKTQAEANKALGDYGLRLLQSRATKK